MGCWCWPIFVYVVWVDSVVVVLGSSIVGHDLYGLVGFGCALR